MTVDRSLPPFRVDERATLTSFLDFQRATLEMKCHGLDEEQLRRRAVPPSALSLLGIVRHMADVERNWFRPLLEGVEMEPIFGAGMDFDAAFREVDAADTEESFARWRAECEHARELVAKAPSLDVTGLRGTEEKYEFSLRWVLTHMIEEYARHNGHADLLRERIDGVTGQ